MSASWTGGGPPSPNGSATDAGRSSIAVPGAMSSSLTRGPASSCRARSASSAATPLPATSTRGRVGMSDLLRVHLDGAARALLRAEAAALAVVQVDRVRVRAGGIELDDGVVGADAEAVVAGEAAAARQAATRFEQRGRGVEPADHLVERRRAAGLLEPWPEAAWRVAVVPGVERLERDGRGGWRRLETVSGQPRVDVARRAAAVAHRHGHGALGGDGVAAGEHAGPPGHEVVADLDRAVDELDARRALEQPEVGLLPERQHQRVGFQRLQLARG